MRNLFKKVNLEKMSESFSIYLPSGKLFDSRSRLKSNFRKMINGLSEECLRAHNILRVHNDQYYPDYTLDYLEEWESVLGIPDECFFVSGEGIRKRQENVIVKLARMNVQTQKDFVELARIFGLEITVHGGLDPIVNYGDFANDKEARFTIVILYQPTTEFDYTFNFNFGGDAIGLLQCVFEKIRPANCQVLFQAA
jgi:uncharacterized protein YmfQ (DUF2313 family)